MILWEVSLLCCVWVLLPLLFPTGCSSWLYLSTRVVSCLSDVWWLLPLLLLLPTAWVEGYVGDCSIKSNPPSKSFCVASSWRLRRCRCISDLAIACFCILIWDLDDDASEDTSLWLLLLELESDSLILDRSSRALDIACFLRLAQSDGSTRGLLLLILPWSMMDDKCWMLCWCAIKPNASSSINILSTLCQSKREVSRRERGRRCPSLPPSLSSPLHKLKQQFTTLVFPRKYKATYNATNKPYITELHLISSFRSFNKYAIC